MMAAIRSFLAHRISHVASLLAALAALAAYLLTRAPGLTFIDAGELAAAAATLGVPHPTGYPLFSLIGHLVAWIPLGAEPIVRLNTMAAVCSALGVLCAGRAAALLATLVAPALQERPVMLGAVAAAAALLLGFTQTYWMQATAVEVYSLHSFLVLSVLAVCLQAASSRDPAAGERLWHLGAFLTGLSFANHMTTIVMVPGLLYLYGASRGWNASLWRRVPGLAVALVGGLSLYLYLPVRAQAGPLMNWGNPATLERLFWHISGKQYSVWMFTSGERAWEQLGAFLTDLPRQTGYVGLLLAVAGVPALWRSSRVVALGLLLMFAATVGYAVNYDIQDIDAYFLLAYVVVALFAASGLAALAKRWRRLQLLVVLVGGAAALLPLAIHYRAVDQSGNLLVEDYTANMFASLPEGALVLSYQWDYWLSASYYAQLVRGERPDLAVIDKELLRRSWYYTQLARQYPGLLDHSRGEIDRFLAEVAKFERNQPYSVAVLEKRYGDVIGSLIERNIGVRPIYVTGEIEPQYTAGFQRVPEGLAFRLHADTLFHPTASLEYRYRPVAREGRLERALRMLYARAFLSRADYYIKKGGEPAEIRKALAEAQKFDPSLARQPGVRRHAP